jgi:hypothetical protein
VRAQQKVAQRLGLHLLQHVADGEEVPERLAHLLVVDLHEAVVHPHPGERLAAGRLGLAISFSWCGR